MAWAKGDQLQEGKYIILRKLGEGGFGTTYKVLHTNFGQHFVIKTINDEWRNKPQYQDILRRFQREAKMLLELSRQSNSHIVGVWDFFKEGKTYCLVMDYVEGESLWDLVKKRGKISQKKAFKYIVEIAIALSIVHAKGLTHRDVHPGNIMIDSDNRAILIDFGLTKDINPSTSTSKGLAGNKAFAPYEQFSQGSREITVDVYSLAASLYFSLTGQLPANSLGRKLHGDDLIPPRRIESSISRKVDNAILAGMALEAKHRPQSIREWWKLLRSETEVSPQRQPVKHSSEKKRTVVPVATEPATQKVQEKRKEPQARTSRKNPNKKPGTLDKIFSSPHIWGWLLVDMLSYGAMSFYVVTMFFAVAGDEAVAMAVAWAMAFAVAGAVAGAVAWGGAVAVAVAVAWGGAVAGAVVGAVAGAVVGAVAWAVAWAEVGVGAGAVAVAWAVAWAVYWAVVWAMSLTGSYRIWEKVSFNWWEIFLIFLPTNLLGVGLGWFVRSYLV